MRGVHSVPSTMLLALSLSLDPSIVFERRNNFIPQRNTNKHGLPIDSLHSRCGCHLRLLKTQMHLFCPFSSISLASASRHDANHPGELVLSTSAPRFVKAARTGGCKGWRLTLRGCCASLSLQPQPKPLLIGSVFPRLHLSHKGAPMSR